MSVDKSRKIPRICEQCGKPFKAKAAQVKLGLARFHNRKCYFEWRKEKSFGKILPLKERFFKHVGPPTPTGCLLWIGSRNPLGYGNFNLNGKTTSSHRVAWQIEHGPIPEQMDVLHDCPGGDNPACVNWKHLWLGNSKDNMADMFKKGRAASQKGERNASAKFTHEQIREIRKLYAESDLLPKDIARRYGVWTTTISDIISWRTWTHL